MNDANTSSIAPTTASQSCRCSPSCTHHRCFPVLPLQSKDWLHLLKCLDLSPANLSQAADGATRSPFPSELDINAKKITAQCMYARTNQLRSAPAHKHKLWSSRVPFSGISPYSAALLTVFWTTTFGHILTHIKYIMKGKVFCFSSELYPPSKDRSHQT